MDQTDAEHDITEKLGQTCACVSEFSDFWSVHRLDDRPKLAKLPNIDAVIHALTYLHDQDAHTTFFVFFSDINASTYGRKVELQSVFSK